jgi:uncharacterized RmlC-like cupin family protein
MAIITLAIVACGLAAGRLRSSAWSLFGPRAEVVGSFVYRMPPADTPYTRWLESTGASRPTFSGLLIQDVRTQPLRPWPQMGVDGLYIQMADYQIVDGWILEIPPHGSTAPQRHLFEAGVYFLGGPGHTVIQQEGRPPQRVDWKYRSLFSVPLNVRYQHFNDSDQPVRLVAVTSFPYVMNSTDSVPFVFENRFEFRDRYDGEADFVTRSDRAHKNRIEANVVDDAVVAELDDHEIRGEGATNMHWSMSGNTMVDLHASEIPAQIYKRAHRHSSDAFILLLSGEGYSLTWPEGQYEKRIRVNWQEGTMFVPPIYWYHQHLNPGKVPARYLAINASMLVTRLGLRFYDQIEADLPQIAREFEGEVARRSAVSTQ